MFLLIYHIHFEASVIVVCRHTAYVAWCLWCAMLESSNSILAHEHFVPTEQIWCSSSKWPGPRELLKVVQFLWAGFSTWNYHHLIQHFWNLMRFWKCVSSGLLKSSLQPLLAGSKMVSTLCSDPWDSTSMHPNALYPLLWLSRFYSLLAMLKVKNKELFLSLFIAEKMKAQRRHLIW